MHAKIVSHLFKMGSLDRTLTSARCPSLCSPLWCGSLGGLSTFVVINPPSAHSKHVFTSITCLNCAYQDHQSPPNLLNPVVSSVFRLCSCFGHNCSLLPWKQSLLGFWNTTLPSFLYTLWIRLRFLCSSHQFFKLGSSPGTRSSWSWFFLWSCSLFRPHSPLWCSHSVSWL